MSKVGVTVVTVKEPLPDDYQISSEELEAHKEEVRQFVKSESTADSTVTVEVEFREEE